VQKTVNGPNAGSMARAHWLDLVAIMGALVLLPHLFGFIHLPEVGLAENRALASFETDEDW
jgi:hypothetical protein